MGHVLVIQVRDVNLRPVQVPTQSVRLDVTATGQAIQIGGSSDPSFVINEAGSHTDIVVSVTGVPDLMPFKGTLHADFGGGDTVIAAKPGSMTAVTRDPTDPQRTVVTVVAGMLREVSHDPEKIKQPPQDGRFTPEETDYAGNTVTALDVPRQPVISRDANAHGRARLNILARPFKDIVPQGRVYIAEIAGQGPPKLVMFWRPDYLKLSPSPRQGIDHHMYFHPAVGGKQSVWGRYPFSDAYVGLGYRHLIWEMWALNQHYQARRKVVFVVPVGSLNGQFGWLLSQGGMLRLLREVNLLMQTQEKVAFDDWAAQDVGRVALSGFSYGGQFLLQALRTAADGPNNPEGYAKTLWDHSLREIYNLDFASDHFDTAGYIRTMYDWWRKDDDRKLRIYSRNLSYLNLGPAMRPMFDKLYPPSSIEHPHFAGDPVATAESHVDDSRSLVLLPGSFFRADQLANPIQFPVYPKDAHHWFPRFFMSHAIGHSGFSPG